MYPIHEIKPQILPFVAVTVRYLVIPSFSVVDEFPFSSKIMALNTKWKLLQYSKHNPKQSETMLKKIKNQEINTSDQTI